MDDLCVKSKYRELKSRGTGHKATEAEGREVESKQDKIRNRGK